MTDTTVRARFEADASGYIKTMGEAEKATTKLADTADKAGQSTKRLGDDANKSVSGWSKMGQAIRDNSQDMTTAGTALGVMGAGLVTAAGASAKFAMDWQSDWAGVQKTNDGTTAQMEQLEGDLRNLARTLPATHTEIAATAEAAGQLGVGVDDVASFSKVMIDLGETTNLSADEAATALARFSNVMGTSFSDADRLGATIVGLGNNFATTEAEIVAMAQRIAPVGRILNMTEADTLSMATAMSSVGINAEAGGTAISTVMRKIDASVREGGEGLIGWAEAAGVSAEDFAQKWQERPAEAMQILSQGLGETAAAGGDVNAILGDLGVKGIRESATMLSLASASGVLTDALAMGADEWEKNTALVAEAELRYQTAESRVAIAWNNIKDSAIDAGASIVPMIADLADTVSTVVQAFGNLPGPVKSALGVFTGLAGVITLGAASLLMLAPRVVDTYDAFKRLADHSPRAAAGLQRVGKAAGAAAAIAAVGIAAAKIVESDYMSKIEDGSTRASRALDLLAEEGPEAATALDDIFKNRDGEQLTKNVEDLETALDRTFNKSWDENFNDWGENIINTVTGIEGSSHILADTWATLDQELANMASGGNTEDAAAAFEKVADKAESMGIPIEDLVTLFPQYGDALRDAGAAESELNSEQVASELEAVGLAADGTVESLGDYLDLLFQAGLAEMSARDAQSRYYDSLRSIGDAVDQLKDPESGLGGLSAALNKNKTDFDLTTEAGALANSALQDVARSGMDMASAMAENGASQEEVQAHLGQLREDLIAAANELGITGTSADDLAGALLSIPEGHSIESWMSDEAKRVAEETNEAVTGIPTEATIDSWMSDEAFVEALRTRAAVLDIPEEDVIDSFMSDAARDEAGKTTAAVLGIEPGVSISSFMADNARKEAQSTNEWLNRIDGRHTTSQHTHTTKIQEFVTTMKSTKYTAPLGNLFSGVGGYTGGRAGLDFGFPHLANGGRLPYPGLGTDMILGVSSMGHPTAMVDDGEWVIRERMSDKYDRALAMINQDHPAVQHLASYASGGRVSRDEERRKALAEMRRDMRVDLRRGEIGNSFRAGNGMSVVDRMLNMSRDENLGKWSRSLLARTSGSLEKQLTTLTRRSDALEESLKKATERRDDLLSTQQSVASSLSGEWSLGSMVTAHRRDHIVDPMNAKTIAGTVSATAARIQKFAWKMGLLRKAGFSEAVITEVSGLGTEDGIMAADILLDSSKSERNAINSAYRQLDKASMYAGSEVTKNMYAGGVNAAMGVVQGLESKQNAIEKAFADMAKRGERAFKSALGIRSPSRVMMGAGQDTGMGAILGVQSMIPDAEQAMRDLAAAQQRAYTVDLASARVPVSAEVTRYAASAQSAPVIDYDRLAKAVGGGLTISPTIHGAVPQELERGIVRATFRELRAQGVPVGEPA